MLISAAGTRDRRASKWAPTPPRLWHGWKPLAIISCQQLHPPTPTGHKPQPKQQRQGPGGGCCAEECKVSPGNLGTTAVSSETEGNS